MLRALMEQRGVEALLITHIPDVRYVCGFNGSNAALAITQHYAVLFTDGRYTTQARQQTKAARVVIARESAVGESSVFISGSGVARCFFDGSHTTVAQLSRMNEAIGSKRGRSFFKALPLPLVGQLRATKDAEELTRLEASALLGCELFNGLLGHFEAGRPEAAVAAELEHAARLAGAEGMSFETIVASGHRSALPHGVASAAPLPRRGFIVLDFGVILRGYCSDMTRTIFMGKATAEERFAYDSVLEAQEAAVSKVKAGVSCGDVDEAARGVLRRRKLARYFTHSTGHGVGLEIHEPPRIAAKQEERLRSGMVVTIEPGVYRAGRFGIRIEDMVLVTEAGGRILTPAPKAWTQL